MKYQKYTTSSNERFFSIAVYGTQENFALE